MSKNEYNKIQKELTNLYYMFDENSKLTKELTDEETYKATILLAKNTIVEIYQKLR